MANQLNLRLRFFLIATLLFLAFAAPAWLAVQSLVDQIMEQWAVRYAEQQTRYDKSRILQPILREISLARKLATSKPIIDFSRNPGNRQFEQRAIAEMENYRTAFSDQSYFVALSDSGRYYHNNREDDFSQKQYRYDLDPMSIKDSWFYGQMNQGRDLHLNVNFDKSLGVTKLWINVLIKDGKNVLGIAGTGLDLTDFIETVVEQNTPGVERFLIDHAGAIQLHRDQRLIDFSSISKSSGEQIMIDRLFDNPADVASIRNSMKMLASSTDTVVTLPIEMNGRHYLVGLTHLPSIDWYELTLLDKAILLPFSQFRTVLGVYVASMAVMMLLFTLAMNHYIIRPLRQLNEAMSGFEHGIRVSDKLANAATGEIRSLMQQFTKLADSVTEARLDLESKVQERTLELDRLTKIDSLTGILNRRGMVERIEADLERSARDNGRVGILLIDIDWFKNINDKHGHATGDLVLATIAKCIENEARPYDFVARWGGDEFLVLVSNADRATLDSLGTRLCLAASCCLTILDAAGTPIQIGLSIGGHLSTQGEDISALLLHADEALYEVKRSGRNAYRSSFSL